MIGGGSDHMRHGIVVFPCHDGLRLNGQDKWFKKVLGAGDGHAGMERWFCYRLAAIYARRGWAATRYTQETSKDEEGEQAIHQAQTRIIHRTSFQCQRQSDTKTSIRCDRNRP